MKPYLLNLVKKVSFPKLLLIAAIIRIVLVPISFHSDLNTNAIWGTYAREFGLRGYYDWLNFGNYARPEYPPFAILIFMKIRHLWEFLFQIVWKINISIDLFPSNLVTWFEKYGYLSLLKLPGILADIGIGYLIYLFVKKNQDSDNEAKGISILYLFNPAVIYISSVWGQIESVVSFFFLYSLILIHKKDFVRGFISTIIAFLTKATYALFIPILVLESFKRKISWTDLTRIIILGFLVIYITGVVFTDHNFISWLPKNYFLKFVTPGGGALPFINLNSFNFWGLLVGLDRVSDKTLFLFTDIKNWAYLISFIFLVFIYYRFWKGADIFFTCLLVAYSSFLFFPHIHERYLFPAMVFFPLVIAKNKDLKKVFFFSSLIFLINLYHWWWVPNISPLVTLFDLELVERGLSLTNLVSFSYLLWKYQSS